MEVLQTSALPLGYAAVPVKNFTAIFIITDPKPYTATLFS
jgi:hypothetical protein